jgi:hypothetical protein
LAGEARQQLDLLVGERADLLPVNPDDANQLVFHSIGTKRNVRAPADSTRATMRGLRSM